ncbi:clasp N-terminal domain-containing protein [Syncephalastrum racemosum]|uniref:Clasp N-terminal domain-containing protein n=1 Tax=Syncephalastrum racemosum TaxID=13706 RepID=A0A1X2GZS6_SYNRA|nr:clasp N-terminal domain-containing protein [Syncephalastrum racemosum]
MKRVIQLFSKNKESEDTWEKFDQALRNIIVWTVDDNAHRYEHFATHLRALKRPIIQSLTTERTRLSKTAFELLQTLAQTMQREYEPLHEMFGLTLVKLFARTNKVQLQRARTCYTHLIDHAKLTKSIPSLCALLKKGTEPNKAVRHGVAGCLEHIIVVNDPQDLKPYLTHLTTAIRQAATDSSPDVRAAIRACFQAYSQKHPDHCARY